MPMGDGTCTRVRCSNLLLVFLFISVLACTHINSSCVLYNEQTIEKEKNIVNYNIENAVHYKKKILKEKVYHLGFVDETIDWFHIKSPLRIDLCCWEVCIIDESFGRGVDCGVHVGRYSFKAAIVNGGKAKTKKKKFFAW